MTKVRLVSETSMLAAVEAATDERAAELTTDARSINPIFSKWSGSFPDGYGTWQGLGPSKETTQVRTGSNALRFVTTDTTTQRGVQFLSTLHPNMPNAPFVTVTVEVMLTAGTFGQSGVMVDWSGIGTLTGDYRAFIHFADKIPNPQLGVWYTITTVLARPGGTGTFTGYSGFLMATYSVLNGAASAKTITFNRFSIVESTESEILAYKSVDTAYFLDVMSRRANYSYRWNNTSDKDAQTGMRHGDEGYLAISKETYRYNGTEWKLWHRAEKDFTPTLGNGYVAGNGTWDASWGVQAGKGFMNGKFTLGSTSVVGGDLQVELPVPSVSGARLGFGGGRMSDASAATVYDAHVLMISSSNRVAIRYGKASTTYVEVGSTTGAAPFSWTSFDSFEFEITWTV